MKQLLEHIKQELIARCKESLKMPMAVGGKPCVKRHALQYFNQFVQCFTDLFDSEEEVLQWLEDEKMI